MNTKNAGYFDTPKNRVIVALDNVESLEQVAALVRLLAPHVTWFKVGFETILAFGAKQMADVVTQNGGKVFLDVKLHDIPNTVENATKKIIKLGVEMFNMHCSSGKEAMQKAKAASPDTLLIGVTVLTSLNDEETQKIYGAVVQNQVIGFALDAKEAGLDGIVCSAKDLVFLKENSELNDLIKITPGVQFPEMGGNDQKRVTTPYQAIKNGATAIVCGRIITGATDPVEASQKVLAEVEKAMSEIAQPA